MRKTIITIILAVWQLFLAVSSFIITQSVWWFWCAICFVIAVAIAGIWEIKRAEKDEAEKYRKEQIEKLQETFVRDIENKAFSDKKGHK
jgi:predicted membrane protein